MDKTEEYVIMCEKSEEIQKEKHRILDMFYSVNVPEHDADGNCWFNRDNKKTVWLPRQDQLQKLTGIESIPTLLSQFNKFVFTNVKYLSKFIDSCEKLWIAFVMKTRYNKIWDGKDWIGEKEAKTK